MTRRVVALSALLFGLVMVPLVPPAAAGHEYQEPVWITWSHKDLDVLIADIHDPLIAQWIQRAIDMWENGIAYWNPSLAAQLTLRVYWPDSGQAPPPGFDPDIAVIPQGFLAWRPLGEAAPCFATAPMLVGWGSFLRVTSHEFGHCLGLHHVFEHGVEYKPSFDIMGDGDGPKCPSNLNVQVLQRALNGQGGSVTISSSSYAQAPSC